MHQMAGQRGIFCVGQDQIGVYVQSSSDDSGLTLYGWKKQVVN